MSTYVQAMVYKADFEEERLDRERIIGEKEEYKASVDQLRAQNQQLRDQIEQLLQKQDPYRNIVEERKAKWNL